MLLINCKEALKLKWAICCVLSAVGADNDNANPNNNSFTIKDKFIYSCLHFTSKSNQKLSKLISNGFVFERSVYWNELE